MKTHITLILTVLALGLSVNAENLTKNGYYSSGYDTATKTILYTDIHVSYSNDSQEAKMTLGSEEAIEGTLERTSIAIYPKNPKKYFYYVLEMNPKKNNGNASYSTEEGSTFTCPPGMNAFLIGYKGDGSKNTFCATLK